ncbi:hypothetical protein BARRIGA_77 [Mycobacterium phage Barriga]|uniref:hypothetical protein n=1 Tax=Mycobacterium phage Barriga TaxID=1675548 RepID=UPI0006A2E345|nr:hypothetical protein BARRIGA_77 [Mycobacterium phage Barriga]AKU44945.1 hypothetical protein BARRIGA_77 [Mycobacterium phage Barriga]
MTTDRSVQIRYRGVEYRAEQIDNNPATLSADGAVIGTYPTLRDATRAINKLTGKTYFITGYPVGMKEGQLDAAERQIDRWQTLIERLNDY